MAGGAGGGIPPHPGGGAGVGVRRRWRCDQKYHRTLLIGKMEGSKTVLLKGPNEGVLRVFEVPSFLLFPQPTRPLNGCFLEPGSPAENGWFCRLIGLQIYGIR